MTGLGKATAEIAIGAATVSVDLGSVNGLEWRAARVAAGYPSQAELMRAFAEGEFDAVAAVFWVAGLREDDDLDFVQTLAGCSYSTVTVTVIPTPEG